MYQLVKAVCVGRSIGSQWKEFDLGDAVVSDIFNSYAKVYMELSNIFLDKHVYIDFDELRNEYSSYQGTLNELFTRIGNRALVDVGKLPNSKIRYAKYSDAIRAGYHVEITKIGVSTPRLYPISELRDIRLTRPAMQTDMKLIHQYCMVSINGFYHRTDTDGVNAYIYDGNITRMMGKENHVGILSFLDIGRVQKYSIDVSKAHAQVDSDLKTRCYLELTGDLAGKTVMLVIGGYLLFQQPGVFWQTGDNLFAVNFASLPLMERYFESVNQIDMSSLNLPTNIENTDMVNVDDFYKDETLKALLSLSQSFWAVIDTPQLFTNKIFVRACGIPGLFTAYQDPTYPLVTANGKMADYWKVKEDGHWSVRVTDSYYKNYVFSTKSRKMLNNITDQCLPHRPHDFSPAHLLEIGAYAI